MSPQSALLRQNGDEDDLEGQNNIVDESTPLFGAVSSSPLSVSSSKSSSNSRKRKRRSVTIELAFDELQQMLKLTIPIIGTYILEMIPGIVSIILVGHIQTDESYVVEEYIDAATLSVMFINMIGLSTGFGLASAMDTLCSQAYGANETHKMGTYMQTGFIVLSILFGIVLIVSYYCTNILIALGQPLGVSNHAGTFTMVLIPGIPFLYAYELMRKVLQAQNIALPMLYTALIANILNVGLGYYLVYHTSYGFIGAAIARTIANISMCLCLLPYLFTSGIISTFWTGLQIQKAIQGIGQFLHLGISGMLQLCFEWWAFEILAVLCGLLPNPLPAIGSNAVILNISSMMYMFYLGISISSNVRIGNALGAGEPKRAKMASNLAVGISITTSMFCAGTLLLFRKQLPHLFTHDEEINILSQKLMLVSAVFQIADAVNAAVQGVFRGSGKQILGAKLNFVAYYVVGIPLGSLFAFVWHYDIVGLWVGMTIGLFVIAIFGTVLTCQSNWSDLAKEAQKRIHIGSPM